MFKSLFQTAVAVCTHQTTEEFNARIDAIEAEQSARSTRLASKLEHALDKAMAK